MFTAPATLRINVPLPVQAPRGALAAADLMLRLLHAIAALRARARSSAATVRGQHD